MIRLVIWGLQRRPPFFLLNVDKWLSVVYNDSQAKLATKDDSRLRRYEIGFRISFFVFRSFAPSLFSPQTPLLRKEGPGVVDNPRRVYLGRFARNYLKNYL